MCCVQNFEIILVGHILKRMGNRIKQRVPLICDQNGLTLLNESCNLNSPSITQLVLANSPRSDEYTPNIYIYIYIYIYVHLGVCNG